MCLANFNTLILHDGLPIFSGHGAPARATTSGDNQGSRGQIFNMMPVGLAQAGVAAAPGDGWLVDPELVERGYGQTMAGGGIQTSLPAMPKPPATPDWLKSLLSALRHFFDWRQPASKPMPLIAATAPAPLPPSHFP